MVSDTICKYIFEGVSMKNTMRKGFLLMAMLAVVLAVGLAFVSCDTMGGGGSALDGTWVDGTNWVYNIRGSTGTISSISTSNLNTRWRDAVNKNYIRTGGTYFRNLTQSGNSTWSGQVLTVTYNTSASSVATGTNFVNCTITLSANGRSFTVYGSDSSGAFTETFTRRN